MRAIRLALLPASVIGMVRNGRNDIALEADKNRPVSKVIVLLKDMMKQLEKEGEEDQEIYEKMACWCETNDREKTKSIKDAEVRIRMKTDAVEANTAQSARLGSEIANGEKEVAANQDALGKATALREKQLAEFNAEEKDMLEAVSALKSAITVLSKHHDSLLQISRTRLLGIAGSVEDQLKRHEAMLKEVLTKTQFRKLEAFIQQPDYMNASPTFKQSYAPQSGEIFGILRQMLETFQENLSASQKEELANAAAYEDLKKAKEAEIQAGLAQIDKKTDEKATTDETIANDKNDIKDTKASLSADEQFLMSLKEKCQMTDKEWEERQKTRIEETQAVSKALEILSSDDAHDTFTKTFNPSLVQVVSQVDSVRRARALQVIQKVENLENHPRMSTLAYNLKLDTFERVIKMIDELHAALTQEHADEVKQKDFCIDEFHQNELQTEDHTRQKEDHEGTMEDLKMTMKRLSSEIKTAKSEIAEMQFQLKRAGEDREKQNKEFQGVVADQRETQVLLKKALSVLEDFYKKSLVQVSQEPAGPPPPAGFKEYGKNNASGGVIGLIQQIIQDAKSMENEAIRSEEDAQKAYEDFVKETNRSIEAKSKEITNKQGSHAKAEGNHIDTKKAHEATVLELSQLANYKGELHTNCDFLIKNFDLRQQSRTEEMDALKQAKAVLQGSDATSS